MTRFEMRRVHPPGSAPIRNIGEEGALRYLQIERNFGPSKCACCEGYIGPQQPIAWVPDYIGRSDPLDALIEATRRNAFNGGYSGWCLECASSIGRKAMPARPVARWFSGIIAEARRALGLEE